VPNLVSWNECPSNKWDLFLMIMPLAPMNRRSATYMTRSKGLFRNHQKARQRKRRGADRNRPCWWGRWGPWGWGWGRRGPPGRHRAVRASVPLSPLACDPPAWAGLARSDNNIHQEFIYANLLYFTFKTKIRYFCSVGKLEPTQFSVNNTGSNNTFI